MKNGKNSEIYQQQEEYFQSNINALTEAGKESHAKLPVLKERTEQQ